MAENIDKDAVVEKLDKNSSSEKTLKERISELNQKLKEQAYFAVEVLELEEKLKKQDAEHKAEVDNLRAEIAKLKSPKQKSTAAVTELQSENEKPSHSDLSSIQHPVCYKQSINIVGELKNMQHNCKNLGDKVSELELKINEQTQLAILVAELQRKVEQSNLATKLSELQYKIEQQSYMERRILKLERQNLKYNFGARVTELDRRVEELSLLSTQMSEVERKSDARNNVSELSLLQLSEKINDLQVRSEEISQRIQSVIGKQGFKQKAQNNNEPAVTKSDYDVCYYHVRFGANANNCVEPCKYMDYYCVPDSTEYKLT